MKGLPLATLLTAESQPEPTSARQRAKWAADGLDKPRNSVTLSDTPPKGILGQMQPVGDQAHSLALWVEALWSEQEGKLAVCACLLL